MLSALTAALVPQKMSPTTAISHAAIRISQQAIGAGSRDKDDPANGGGREHTAHCVARDGIVLCQSRESTSQLQFQLAIGSFLLCTRV